MGGGKDRRKEEHMGKYYSYGQRLDEAFKTAREEYLKAYNELEAAEKEVKAAEAWKEEFFIGDRAMRKVRAAARLAEAKIKFAEVERSAWPAFVNTMDMLTRQLEKEIKAGNMVAPDGIDNNGLELLKSGIMSPDEMASFVEKYDGNATMLKLVSKYASEAAEKAQDPHQRARYNTVAYATREGFGKALKQWNDVCYVAKMCAGKARERREDPAHIVNMSSRWEELSAAAIAAM